MLRRIIVGLLSLIAFTPLMLFSCGDGTGQTRVDIAIIGKTRSPYWDDVELGSKAAGKRLGVKVRFSVSSEENPASWQIREMEKLIAVPVDGLAFAAADVKTLEPTILKAMRAGIPCVAIDTDVGKRRHAYVGTNDYNAGEQAAKELVSILSGQGRIAIISSFSANTDSLKRLRGFRDEIADSPDIKIAATVEKQHEAVSMGDLSSLLNSYPDLDGIFCASDMDSILAAEAAKKSGKAGQISMVSIGESPELMKYVKTNVIQAAVVRSPYRTGFLSVLVLHNMAKVGIQNTLRILPKLEIINVSMSTVTPANIDMYREGLRELGIKVDL